ncbi:MAG: UDP-glucose 4-epimerase GalE [Bdellovibrionota bacterium]
MGILVTGGAGYIGSHFIEEYRKKTSEKIVVIDDLSSGQFSNLPADIPFFKNDFSDSETLNNIFKDFEIHSLIHFAAKTSVTESFQKPDFYQDENTTKAVSLFKNVIQNGIKRIVFSSTAAVYGSPQKNLVTESDSTIPESPYGSSKLNAEIALKKMTLKHKDVNYAILRYFNVAGANLDANLGPSDQKTKHLIKACAEAATGINFPMKIFGNDYPTKDGTCERDFIHVIDLALAHISALNYIIESRENVVFNCGYGEALSVSDVVAVMQKVSNNPFEVEILPRRSGDIPRVVADPTKIKKLTNWKPKHQSIEEICESSYKWELKNDN